MIAPAGDELMSGFAALLLGLLILVAAVLWILFPILVLKFNELLNPSARFSRSHDSVIRVYDAAANVIETHEHKGDFKECS